MDIEYLLLLQKIRDAGPGFLADLSTSVSDIGYHIWFSILFFLFWCFRKEAGLLGLLGLELAQYITSVIKLCACVYRPWIRDPRVVPPASAKFYATGYSFPSGHTTTCVGSCGMLAWLFRKKTIVLILCIIVILQTMFLRNLLGVHTPQDVIVGCMTGFLAVFLVCLLMKWESAGQNRDLIILGVLIVLDIGLMFFFTYKSYPMDYDAAGKLLVDPVKMQKDGWKDLGRFTGLIIGWIIEKRFVKFTVPDSWKIRFARYVPGLILFSVANGFFRGLGLRDLCTSFLGDKWGAFTGGIFLYILFIAIYPMLFMKIEKIFAKQSAGISR